MVAGHLRVQNGIYQMIFSYKDANKKRKTKSISTGLPEKGNKKRALAMLDQAKKEFIPSLWNKDTLLADYLSEWANYAGYTIDDITTLQSHISKYIVPYFSKINVSISEATSKDFENFFKELKRSLHLCTERDKHNIIERCHYILRIALNQAVEKNWITQNVVELVNPYTGKTDILFADFILTWLSVMKNKVELTTYAGYSNAIKKRIEPYFREKKYTLRDLEENPQFIQDYYQYELNELKLSTNTILHRHANIRKCLQYAYQLGYIDSNPADRIEKPKKNDYSASYYTAEELNLLFKTFKGDPIEIPVILAAFYGMRRSEVVGLKWSAIDLDRETITVKHTVTDIYLDDHVYRVEKDKTKSKSSTRTLPLVEPFKLALENLKDKQAINQKICGDSYNYDDIDYINVDSMGNRIKPHFISQHFRLLLKKNGLKLIRYHDLRHSCASLLYANGVDMRAIQEWLGHSTITTTSNIYTHFDYSKKKSSANAILNNYPT